MGLVRVLTWALIVASLLGSSAKHLREPVLIDNPVVKLPAGQFRADRLQVNGSTYLRLRGVQYAEHPVGALRWQPPVPLSTASDGIIDALAFGNDCVQGPLLSRLGMIGLHPMGEDCLFLNIWAPETAQPLPILFWIHGGAFNQGGSSHFSVEGVMAIRRDVVVVTSNYRLGAMGFLAGDAIQRSASDGSAGNFALQDNREALRWVKRNIGALGGDASRLTIFGQSSGASQVTTHMVMPRSAGLFNAAIAQSGAWDNFTVQAVGLENQNFHTFAQHAGCGDAGNDDSMLACLRERPLRTLFGGDIMKAIANTSQESLFGPTVDGVEITDIPENLAAHGLINELDAVLLGTVHDEARFMMPLTEGVPGGPFTNESEFHQWVESHFPDVAHEVFQLYKADDYGSNWWYTAAALYTDQQYVCPAARSARWLARSGKVASNATYVYEVTYAPESYKRWAKWWYFRDYCLPGFTPVSGHLNHFLVPCPEMFVDIGVGHASELNFLFPGSEEMAGKEIDVIMTEGMIGWWQSFAANHNPTIKSNGSALARSVDWKHYSLANQTFNLNPQNPRAMSNNRARFCEFWDRQHAMRHDAIKLVQDKPMSVVV